MVSFPLQAAWITVLSFGMHAPCVTLTTMMTKAVTQSKCDVIVSSDSHVTFSLAPIGADCNGKMEIKLGFYKPVRTERVLFAQKSRTSNMVGVQNLIQK